MCRYRSEPRGSHYLSKIEIHLSLTIILNVKTNDAHTDIHII